MKRNVKINMAKFLAGTLMISSSVISGSLDLAKDIKASVVSSIASVLEPVEVYASVEEIAIGDFKIKFNTSNGEIISYVSGEGHLEIPEKINGVTVKSIRSFAFSECSNLTSIIIPDSVTLMGDYVFSDCSNLTSVTMSNNLTSIGNFTFSNCSDLTSVIIPDSVILIGNYAFSNCTSLTSISIPNSITLIEYSAFYMCYNLKNVYYDGSQDNWEKIDIGKSNLIADLSDINSYDGYYKKGDYYNKYLIDATMSYNLTMSDSEDDLTNIPSYPDVDGSEDVTESNCTYETITKPEMCTSTLCIPTITTVMVCDEDVSEETTETPNIYNDCDSVNLNLNIKIANVYVDVHSEMDTESVKLYEIEPNQNILVLEENINNTDWDKIYLNGKVGYVVNTYLEAGSNYDTIGCYTVDGVLGGNIYFDTARGMIVGGYGSITQLHIPDKINGVAVLGIIDGAFKNLKNLTSIKIPYGLSYIPDNAFYGCTSLEYVYLPSTIHRVGTDAFYGIESLLEVEFGGSEYGWNNELVLDGGNDAINNCIKKYTILYNKSYSITDIYTNAFYNSKLEGIINETCTIVSGSLPPGIGLYDNGLLYGIPTKSGTYTFIVKNGESYYQYLIIIKEPTSNNLISTNEYAITTMLPIIDSNTNNYQFVVDKNYINFNNLYINGVRLVKEVDYEISGTKDTRITVYSSFLSKLPEGENIITSVFNTSDDDTSGRYGNENTASTSQLFNKESEQDMSSSMTFGDVKTTEWYYKTLEYLYKTGIMKGRTDEIFAPTDNLTRAELVLTLYRIDGSKVTAQNSFTDVKTTDWYAEAVSWAKDNSIVNGTTDGSTFSPNEPITKEDMATIINRYSSYKGIQIPLGTSGVVGDINAVADYAKGHVNTMYQGGILNTDEDNSFNPKVPTSRADVAYILANFLLKY